MKNCLKTTFFAVLVAFALSFAASAYSADGKGIVRVGLAYGNSAALSVNAFSETGFSLGYFEEGDVFCKIADIDNRFVSFAADKNLYYSDSSLNADGAGQKVNSLHLEYGAFSTYADALAVRDDFAAALSGIDVFVAYVNGVYSVRIDHFSTVEYAEAAKAGIESAVSVETAVTGGSPTCVTVVDMNTGSIVFEVDLSEFYPAAFARLDGENDLLKNKTTFYKGAFEFKRFDGGNINFINVVTMDDYLAGVLSGEMSASWPKEALKAQAICARGYYVCNSTKHSRYGFGVCATTDCQMYLGTTNASASILEAVAETSGVIVAYESEPISPFFHSSSGGYTESNYNVWGGIAYPYYAAVDDIYTKTSEWTSTFTSAELEEGLLARGYKLDGITDFYVSQYTEPAGNVYAVTFVYDGGKEFTISRNDTVRIALSKWVKSSRFKIYKNGADIYIKGSGDSAAAGTFAVIGGDGSVESKTSSGITVLDGSGSAVKLASGDGSYTVTGTGWGHNVGMSQYGAREMAIQGKTANEIIEFYFTGATSQKFDQLCVDFEFKDVSGGQY